MTNEELVKAISRPCSVQKLWVMLKKFDPSTPTSLSSFIDISNNEIQSQSNEGLCDLIPRSGFSPSRRTHLVEVTVTHRAPTVSPMDLTPCIGKLVTQSGFKFRKLSSKRSLGFGVNNVSKRYSFSNDVTLHDSVVMSDLLDITNPHSNSYNDSPATNDCMSVCSGPGLMTPRDILKGPEPIIETPTVSSSILDAQAPCTASPSRVLASRMSNFNISDTYIDKSAPEEEAAATWYQVDYVLKGFKDTCFR